MKIIRFLMPRIEYILFAAIFWGIASTGPILLNSDGDLPRHLLVGKLIRQSQTVHTTDIFSYRTVGYPSIPHEWLSQVILSVFDDLLGLGGVVLLTALIVTAVWWMSFHDAMRRSGSLFASVLITALGVGASLIHVLPRPHLFSYLFTVLWMRILEGIHSGSRRWWLLPLLMLLWVNLHGMFVLGLIVWMIYLAGSVMENPTRAWFTDNRTKSMLMGGAISFAATFLSPSGFNIWSAIASLGGNAYIKSRIPEYQPANFHMPETWPFILILLLAIVSFARSGKPTRWTEALLVAAFTGVALYSSRMLPLFAIVAAPIAAEAFAIWIKSDFSNSRFLAIEKNFDAINKTSNGILWIIAVFLAITLLFKSHVPIDVAGKGNVFDPKFFPVDAVNWLKSNPQDGHVFNEFDWGGYILLRLWPQYPIFMDGHTHIYGERLTREYEQVVSLSDGWQDVLDHYQVEWAIVRAESSIANALEETGWRVPYKDETTIILRKPNGHQP
jgi:hypothetical protein